LEQNIVDWRLIINHIPNIFIYIYRQFISKNFSIMYYLPKNIWDPTNVKPKIIQDPTTSVVIINLGPNSGAAACSFLF